MSSFYIRHNTGLKWVKQRMLQLQLVVFQFLIVKVIKKSIYMIIVRVINKKYLDNNGNSRIWKIVNDTKHVITHLCLLIPPMCSQLKPVGLFKNSWQFLKINICCPVALVFPEYLMSISMYQKRSSFWQ